MLFENVIANPVFTNICTMFAALHKIDPYIYSHVYQAVDCKVSKLQQLFFTS
jgi:hypothetical protein